MRNNSLPSVAAAQSNRPSLSTIGTLYAVSSNGTLLVLSRRIPRRGGGAARES